MTVPGSEGRELLVVLAAGGVLFLVLVLVPVLVRVPVPVLAPVLEASRGHHPCAGRVRSRVLVLV